VDGVFMTRTTPCKGVYGRPTGHGHDTGFTHAAISVGRIGEQATAEMIDPLGTQAMVFHGFKLPVKLATDIDHLIVRDNAMLAIDSKFWQAGTYRVIRGELYRGLRRIQTPGAILGATKILAQHLTTTPDVQVITVVHSKHGNAKIKRSCSRLQPPVFDEPTARQFINQWLAEHPGLPQRPLSSQVLKIYRTACRRDYDQHTR